MRIILKKDRPADNLSTEIVFEKQPYTKLICSGKKQTLSVGVEDSEQMNERKFILLMRRIIVQAKNYRIQKISINSNQFNFFQLKLTPAEIGEILGTQFEMAAYEFNRYQTPPKEGWQKVEEVCIYGKVTEDFKKSVIKGQIIGQYVNEARELSNIPGSDMTPALLAEAAKQTMKGTKATVKILNKQEMEKLQMGGILSVAKGSAEEPKLILIEYKGAAKKNDKPIVLIGKGVTFDTGGINLKPSNSLKDMQMDMSGGAAVIKTIAAAAKLGIEKNLVAIVAAVENMPSGTSYRPGDVIKTMSGKTVEIGNTDAEGRVTLTDTLTYAKKFNPSLVITTATLTGAAVVALGYRASALYTKETDLQEKFIVWGEKSGDYVWPMPLWEEYEQEVKGKIADLINTGKYDSWGGCNTGAAFLYQFAKDYPWVYIDIAPRTTVTDDEFLSKGAAGAPVRLLIKALENLK
jgi:leucyl aminopeptidase